MVEIIFISKLEKEECIYIWGRDVFKNNLIYLKLKCASHNSDSGIPFLENFHKTSEHLSVMFVIAFLVIKTENNLNFI